MYFMPARHSRLLSAKRRPWMYLGYPGVQSDVNRVRIWLNLRSGYES